ncbi:unnamed protein product [Calicophoron daubneyi]|uniref:Uncharacterized protein n=1 Tax=Calicophoron daubneyi TaxID=300641 RepID=A0AAV2TC21_CALDB
MSSETPQMEIDKGSGAESGKIDHRTWKMVALPEFAYYPFVDGLLKEWRVFDMFANLNDRFAHSATRGSFDTPRVISCKPSEPKMTITFANDYAYLTSPPVQSGGYRERGGKGVNRNGRVAANSGAHQSSDTNMKSKRLNNIEYSPLGPPPSAFRTARQLPFTPRLPDPQPSNGNSFTRNQVRPASGHNRGSRQGFNNQQPANLNRHDYRYHGNFSNGIEQHPNSSRPQQSRYNSGSARGPSHNVGTTYRGSSAVNNARAVPRGSRNFQYQTSRMDRNFDDVRGKSGFRGGYRQPYHYQPSDRVWNGEFNGVRGRLKRPHFNDDGFYLREQRAAETYRVPPRGRRTTRPDHFNHDERDNTTGIAGNCALVQLPERGLVTTPSTDEYIDDFTPEDLAKYKLEINMDHGLASQVRSTAAKANQTGEEQKARGKNSRKRTTIPRTQVDSVTGYQNGCSKVPVSSVVCSPPSSNRDLDSGLGASVRLRRASEGSQGLHSTRGSSWASTPAANETNRCRSWPDLFQYDDAREPRSFTSPNTGEAGQVYFGGQEEELLHCGSCSILPTYARDLSVSDALRRRTHSVHVVCDCQCSFSHDCSGLLENVHQQPTATQAATEGQ